MTRKQRGRLIVAHGLALWLVHENMTGEAVASFNTQGEALEFAKYWNSRRDQAEHQ